MITTLILLGTGNLLPLRPFYFIAGQSLLLDFFSHILPSSKGPPFSISNFSSKIRVSPFHFFKLIYVSICFLISSCQFPRPQ